MNKDLQRKTRRYLKEHGRRKRCYRVLTVLSAIVVFCTTYAMALPAITLEQTACCGYEEHAEHRLEDGCYESVQKLICGLDGEIHTHTDACYGQQPVLTCTIAETEGHTHTDACYKEDRVISCGMEETAGHTHDGSCYEVTCLLSCGIEENEEHTHGDSCYTEDRKLICTLKEHPAHHHDDACYKTESTLICGMEETAGHTHDDSCYTSEPVLLCGQTEGGTHVHTDACYSTELVLVCEKPIHTHTVKCFSKPEEENDLAVEIQYFCGLAEHTHSDACLVEQQVGQQLEPEVPEHAEAMADPEEDQKPEDVDDGREVEIAKREKATWKGVAYSDESGMPIPRLFQGDYPQTVCHINGRARSVASSGCGATSMSMVIAYLTDNTDQNPYTLFYDAVQSGRYHGSGLSHGTLTYFANKYDIHSEWIANSADAIRDALNSGKPVIAHMGPGYFTNYGHYIVLRGLTADGKVLVNDPASSSNCRKAFDLSMILEEARTDSAFMVCWTNDRSAQEETVYYCGLELK